MIADAWAAVTEGAGSLDWNVFWVNLFAALPPTLAALGTWWQVSRNRKMAKKEREKEAQEVKNALEEEAKVVKKTADKVEASLRVTTQHTDERLNDLKNVTNDTHTLVNSNMGKVLRIAAIATKRLADQTKDPEDIRAAEEAQAACEAHERRQGQVDQSVRERHSKSSKTAREVNTIGEAVSEIGTDVKEVKENVQDLKDASEEAKQAIRDVKNTANEDRKEKSDGNE